MATTSPVPSFVRLGNILTTTLLRAGVKMAGPGGVPMYLLTVRGRKSGQPRTIPIVVLERDGKRYLVSPYGIVDWVRNVRAAGEAILTRARRSEQVRVVELPSKEAALVLRTSLEQGIPSFLAKYFEVTAQSSPEEFVQAAAKHPVFSLEKK
jgi:deazaflavin-dependent oxidoreductase (nitroreductase family)